jgi:tetratricopeptide (TPR) repeat protein
MKIIRWLLSHSFLFLLIVIVIYGYMFWGNLLGKETPAGKAIAYLSSEFVEVADFVDAVKAKQTQLNGESMSPQVAPKTSMIMESEIAAEDNAQYQPIKTDEKSLQESPQENSDLAVTAKLTESQGIGTLNQPQSATSVAEMKDSAIQETFVSPEIERQLENVDDRGKVVDESSSRDGVIASWILARRSFYQRNYQLSEQSYQNVIDRTEDNFDAYGELGNVYFNQGKKQQAATAYFEAGAILVRKGQINRARSLVGLLNLLNKDKAIKLQKLIKTVSS